jgi:hypothetical protein
MLIRRFSLLSATVFLLLALAGCPGMVRVMTAEVTLWERTETEAVDYGFSGRYDLSGTLVWTADTGEWEMEGSFTFPTGGYSVLPADILVAESFPEQVFITLKVLQPAPGAITTQALEEQAFSRTFQASSEARITMVLQEFSPSLLTVPEDRGEDGEDSGDAEADSDAAVDADQGG